MQIMHLDIRIIDKAQNCKKMEFVQFLYLTHLICGACHLVSLKKFDRNRFYVFVAILNSKNLAINPFVLYFQKK